jgi:hypothetical protein
MSSKTEINTRMFKMVAKLLFLKSCPRSKEAFQNLIDKKPRTKHEVTLSEATKAELKQQFTEKGETATTWYALADYIINEESFKPRAIREGYKIGGMTCQFAIPFNTDKEDSQNEPCSLVELMEYLESYKGKDITKPQLYEHLSSIEEYNAKDIIEKEDLNMAISSDSDGGDESDKEESGRESSSSTHHGDKSRRVVESDSDETASGSESDTESGTARSEEVEDILEKNVRGRKRRKKRSNKGRLDNTAAKPDTPAQQTRKLKKPVSKFGASRDGQQMSVFDKHGTTAKSTKLPDRRTNSAAQRKRPMAKQSTQSSSSSSRSRRQEQTKKPSRKANDKRKQQRDGKRKQSGNPETSKRAKGDLSHQQLEAVSAAATSSSSAAKQETDSVAKLKQEMEDIKQEVEALSKRIEKFGPRARDLLKNNTLSSEEGRHLSNIATYFQTRADSAISSLKSILQNMEELAKTIITDAKHKYIDDCIAAWKELSAKAKACDDQTKKVCAKVSEEIDAAETVSRHGNQNANTIKRISDHTGKITEQQRLLTNIVSSTEELQKSITELKKTPNHKLGNNILTTVTNELVPSTWSAVRSLITRLTGS